MIKAYTQETLNDDVTYGKLIIDGTIDKDIKKEDILMCSYFNCVRFNDDALQLDYESNITAGATIELKEVNDRDIEKEGE